VRRFEIDPCFVFHPNAYEDTDSVVIDVVIDVVRHDRMFATVLNGPDEGPSTLASVHRRPRCGQGARGAVR
jgi:carotenoid cleavage dioxygenase